MSLNATEMLAERDEQWRDAIVPGGPSTIRDECVKDPTEAYLWLKAVQASNYESVIYFEKRATKARLRRREAEHNIELIAAAWEQSKYASSDPHFPSSIEALLIAALAKKKRRQEPT